MYGSETIIWKEKGRSRIKAFQMDNLRGVLGIRKINRMPNVQSDEGLMKVFSNGLAIY